MNINVAATQMLARFRDIDDAPVQSLEHPTGGDAVDWPTLVENGWQTGTPVNPFFEFSESFTPDRLRHLTIDAQTLATSVDDPLLTAFAQYLREQVTWATALATHDANAIAEASMSIHGTISQSVYAYAQEIVHALDTPDPEPGSVEPATAAHVLEQVLREAGATGWSCVVSHALVARMSVSAARQQVRLNASALFTPSEIVRLSVHEVGVHVMRSVHGSRQVNPLLALGIGPRHLPTEEGLAVWLEEQVGVLSEPDLRKYALRVLAAEAACSGSFADVYATVRPHTTAANAYTLTMRVKRGIADTSQPGGYVKDKVYLEGLLHARCELHYRVDPRIMWAGKISFDLLPHVLGQVNDGRITVPTVDPVELGATLATVAAQSLTDHT